MDKLLSLKIKNVSGSRQFFAPLNRSLKPMETVDVLIFCEGDTKLALRLSEPYKRSKLWQVFDLYKEPLSSPEGALSNASAPQLSEEAPNAVLAPKEVPKTPARRVGSPKRPETRSDDKTPNKI